MKIFFITSKLNFLQAGGSVIEIDLMMRELVRFGHEVTAVTVFSNINAIPQALPYALIEEQILSSRQLGIQWAAYKILKKYAAAADVFYIDGHLLLYGAGLYRRLGGRVPIFAYFNRELISWGENVSNLFKKAKPSLFKMVKQKIRWLVERYFLMWFARTIDYSAFLNPILEQEYDDFGLRCSRKSIIIGDPYDYVSVMKSYGLTENSYGQRNKRHGQITLFYSGRMTPGKGYDLVITAFSKITNKERFRLILGGTGPEEPQVRSLIDKLGLQSYIELPGWVTKEQLHKRLSQEADIYIFARWRRDMSSVALTEVLAFGLPSIVPAGGGLAYVAGKSGLTFEPENPADLARKIEQLGSNPELREQLSRQCYLRLKEPDLDFQKTLPAVEQIMKRLSTESKQTR